MGGGCHSHNGEDEVCKETDELDQSEPELGLAKGLDTKELEGQERKLVSRVSDRKRGWV